MVKVVTLGYHCGDLGVRMMLMIDDADLLTLVDGSDATAMAEGLPSCAANGPIVAASYSLIVAKLTEKIAGFRQRIFDGFNTAKVCNGCIEL